MKLLLSLLTVLALSATGLCMDAPKRLETVDVLPLLLDDSFQFRKSLIFLYDPYVRKPTQSLTLNFMWQRMDYGSVTGEERRLRYGHYFTFYWRSQRKANLTFRLEYRQQNIGSIVQAQELYYKDIKGSVRSDFAVVGDDYEEDGRITGWRAILIEDGKIVALHPSFLWH